MALDSDRRASSGYLIAGATTGTEWRGQRGEEDKSLLSFLCPFQFFRKHPKRLSPRFDVMRVFRYYYLCHSLLGCYDVEVTLIDEGGHDSS